MLPGEAIRALVLVPRVLGAGKPSRWRAGYGAVFAVFAHRSLGEGGHGTSFIGCRCDRGTNYIAGTVIITGDGLYKWHWRSIAVQARPKPEYYLGAEFKLWATVRVRVQCYAVSV